MAAPEATSSGKLILNNKHIFDLAKVNVSSLVTNLSKTNSKGFVPVKLLNGQVLQVNPARLDCFMIWEPNGGDETPALGRKASVVKH